jgi:hypothetical protein
MNGSTKSSLLQKLSFKYQQGFCPHGKQAFIRRVGLGFICIELEVSTRMKIMTLLKLTLLTY